ncbi:MAG: HD domain-containing protein [Acholeplasmatales bacterium]|nr:HD domain-containing protein [Acholeplasmatales bacterium]
MILNKDIEKILDVISNMSKENDYYVLLEDILETGMKISNCDGGTLYLKNEDKLEFFFMITKSQNIKKGGKDEKIDLPPVDINSSSVAAYCGRTKRIVNVEDVYSDKNYNWEGPKKYDKLTGYHTESVLVLPLFDKDKNVLGVMQLINASQFKKVVPFSYDVERIIYSLSSLSGMLLDNIKLYDDIKELLDSFVKAMVKAIESRTPYNAFHTVNVAKICGEFVDYINEKKYDIITEDEKEELLMAAYLHDVGKIIVPSKILNKATRFETILDKMLLRYDLIKASIEINYLKGNYEKELYDDEIKLINKAKEFIIELDKKSYLTDEDKEFIESIKDKTYNTEYGKLKLLTDEEYLNAKIEKGTLTQDERAEIEKHVVYTHNILNELKFGRKYKKVKEIASNHHEYLNGSGYPNHIKDENISKFVRIITISDIYESLISSDRPYKKPIPNDKALFILNEMVKEGKLDKRLVEIFTELKSK